jgi:hypothetical protein
MIHQTAIVIVAYQVVRLDLPVAAKFPIVAALGLALTAGGCALARRWRPLRAVFGIAHGGGAAPRPGAPRSPAARADA